MHCFHAFLPWRNSGNPCSETVGDSRICLPSTLPTLGPHVLKTKGRKTPPGSVCCVWRAETGSGLPDSANMNRGHWVKLEFQLNNHPFLDINMSYAIFGMHIYYKISHCFSEIQILPGILCFICKPILSSFTGNHPILDSGYGVLSQFCQIAVALWP